MFIVRGCYCCRCGGGLQRSNVGLQCTGNRDRFLYFFENSSTPYHDARTACCPYVILHAHSTKQTRQRSQNPFKDFNCWQHALQGSNRSASVKIRNSGMRSRLLVFIWQQNSTCNGPTLYSCKVQLSSHRSESARGKSRFCIVEPFRTLSAE